MSFLFNSKPLIACSNNIPLNQRRLYGSNPLRPSFVVDSDLNISSNHAKTILPCLVNDYDLNYCPTVPNSQIVSGFEFPLFRPSELIAEYPDPYAPISPLDYPDYPYLGNQGVFYEPNNTDMRGKRASDRQPYAKITQQSSFVENPTLDFMPRVDNDDNHTSYDEAFVHRFNQKSLPPESADFLSLGTPKRKALEGDEEEERKKRRNIHRCNLCDMGFSTGNALGGHMSYHAKKNKLEANKRNVKPQLMSSPYARHGS